MKSKLLITAILVMAAAAPVAGFFGEVQMQRSVTNTEFQLPFLHGYLGGEPAKTELASFERATEWLNSPPLTPDALRVSVTVLTLDGVQPARDTFAWTVLSALAGNVETNGGTDNRITISLQKARGRAGTEAGPA